MTGPAVPALGAARRARKLSAQERTLPSGLRVVTVRKPGVPMVEVRLRIPALSPRATQPARVSLLANTALAGTPERDRAEVAAAVQSLGADLSVYADADRVLFGGNVLAANLAGLLGLLAEVLEAADYPAAEVRTERDRLVEHVTIARSRPGVVAAEALAMRMWGRHPYALDLPSAAAVSATGAPAVRRTHAELIRPGGAVLTLVGDLTPARVLDRAEAALGSWSGRAAPARVPALPTPPPSRLLIVDRPGSVQSSIRLGGVAVPRTDPQYPALQLANLVFGGYFSSRWMANLREDKGYTYGPHSRIDHHALGSVLELDAEVASDVTAPALLETRYELGRIATLPMTAAELGDAREYAIGTLALSTATQAGLASTLSALSAFGLGLDWIREHPARLRAVTLDQAAEAAAAHFAPARLTAVVVGDAATIGGPLRALEPVDTDA